MPRLPWSAIALVAANLFPLLGTLLWGWTLFDLLALYWAETGIIGLFNLLKLLRISPAKGIPLGLFFVVHFGMFMGVHGVFLVVLFSDGGILRGGSPDFHAMERAISPGLLPLLGSHGYSFVANFLRGREYEGRTVDQQMLAPYGRIVLMHVFILFGGLPIALLGAGSWALALLVAGKTLVDLRAHGKEHRSGAT